MAARPLARRRPDPGRSPSGDRALGGAGRGGGSARRRRSAGSARARRREGDGEVVLVIGIPGAGKSRVAAEYVGARLRQAESRRAWRVAARARRGTRRGAGGGRTPRRARQHVSDPGGEKRRDEVAAPPRDRDPVRLAGHAARAGAGQPRRTPARTPRHAADAGTAAGAGADRARRAHADVPDAHATGAGAAVQEEGFAAVEHVPFVRAASPPGADRRPRAAGVLAEPGWEDAVAEGNQEAPHLVYDWNPDGDEAVLTAGAERLAAVVSGRGPGRAVPAPRRPARLLVPAAAAGPGARVRTRARDRPVALDRDRRRDPRIGRSRPRSARATWLAMSVSSDPGQDLLSLLDWRRRIADLYARVRANPDHEGAWRAWRDVRDELFARHPQSPLDPSGRGVLRPRLLRLRPRLARPRDRRASEPVTADDP